MEIEMEKQVCTQEQMQSLIDRGVDVSNSSAIGVYCNCANQSKSPKDVCTEGSCPVVKVGYEQYQMHLEILESNAVNYDFRFKGEYPTVEIGHTFRLFTTDDLMQMLPSDVCDFKGGMFNLAIYKRHDNWIVDYQNRETRIHEARNSSLITALYDPIIWLLDNGYELNKVEK